MFQIESCPVLFTPLGPQLGSGAKSQKGKDMPWLVDHLFVECHLVLVFCPGAEASKKMLQRGEVAFSRAVLVFSI